ncbi:MAG TPA: hypothetical protein P5056_02190 [Candidatus Paceibacterota bacterium]|nr:hypothetical protein [Candidatus Paceibacterota bacterium]
MNKKFLLALALLSLAMPVAAAPFDQNRVGGADTSSAAGEDAKNVKATATPEAVNQGRGEERRSEVANAVQEMLRVADRDGGIGERVREIARDQQDESVKAEDTLKLLKNRGQFRKFVFGSDYKKISDIEELLARHNARLAELESMLPQVKTDADRAILSDKIGIMKNLGAEMQQEVDGVKDVGFSLFGWLNKMIYKK